MRLGQARQAKREHPGNGYCDPGRERRAEQRHHRDLQHPDGPQLPRRHPERVQTRIILTGQEGLANEHLSYQQDACDGDGRREDPQREGLDVDRAGCVWIRCMILDHL